MEKISIEAWVCVAREKDSKDVYFLGEVYDFKEDWLDSFYDLGYDKDYELIDVVKISYNKEV